MQPLDVSVLPRGQYKRLEIRRTSNAAIQKLAEVGKSLFGIRPTAGRIGIEPIQHLRCGPLRQNRRVRSIREGTNHRTLQRILSADDYPLPVPGLLAD